MKLRARTAFTLVELLVIISIISLLLSLALPTLSSVRHKSVESLCMSRIRSAGIAVSMYSDDYRGIAPFGGRVARTVTNPAGEQDRIGGHNGLYLGLWVDLFPADWVGPLWPESMMCPNQPPYDPAAPDYPDASLSIDGFRRQPYYDMSAAFHLAPESLVRGIPLNAMRVSPERLSSVAYPSSKVLLYEFLGHCISRTPESMFWIEQGQTQRYATSVAAVDGSVFRYARRNAYEPAFGVGLEYTMHGVLGRDIDHTLIGADAHSRYGHPDSWADTD